jgi:hypothetical protein
LPLLKLLRRTSFSNIGDGVYFVYFVLSLVFFEMKKEMMATCVLNVEKVSDLSVFEEVFSRIKKLDGLYLNLLQVQNEFKFEAPKFENNNLLHHRDVFFLTFFRYVFEVIFVLSLKNIVLD